MGGESKCSNATSGFAFVPVTTFTCVNSFIQKVFQRQIEKISTSVGCGLATDTAIQLFTSFPSFLFHTLEDMGPLRYVKMVKLTTALGGKEKLKVGFIIYHGTGPVWFKKTKQMKSSKFSFATWACTSSWVAVLGNAQVCSSGSDRSLHTSGRVAALQQWITERAPPSTRLQLQKLDLCKTPGIRKW